MALKWNGYDGNMGYGLIGWREKVFTVPKKWNCGKKGFSAHQPHVTVSVVLTCYLERVQALLFRNTRQIIGICVLSCYIVIF